MSRDSLARGLPGGIQAQDMRHAVYAGLVSCSGGRTTACDPHARLEAAWTQSTLNNEVLCAEPA